MGAWRSVTEARARFAPKLDLLMEHLPQNDEVDKLHASWNPNDAEDNNLFNTLLNAIDAHLNNHIQSADSDSTNGQWLAFAFKQEDWCADLLVELGLAESMHLSATPAMK